MVRDWVNLEEALELALKEGRENDFLPLLNSLPLEKKEKYRELWKKTKLTPMPKQDVCQHGVNQNYKCFQCESSD